MDPDSYYKGYSKGYFVGTLVTTAILLIPLEWNRRLRKKLTPAVENAVKMKEAFMDRHATIIDAYKRIPQHMENSLLSAEEREKLVEEEMSFIEMMSKQPIDYEAWEIKGTYGFRKFFKKGPNES